MVYNLDYESIKLHGSRKDYCKIEQENNFCNNVFCYENELTYPVMYQITNLKNR